MAYAPDGPSHTRGSSRPHAGPLECAPLAAQAQLVERLLEQHQRRAYGAGYQQAVADLKSMTVWLAESFLREQGGDASALRRPVYAFVERLERAIQQLPRGQFVEDGLGI
jgi:hypothetical protein